MAEGFSRRSWLLGAFAGLAGLVGLHRKATAAPAVSRPQEVAPVLPAGVSSYLYYEGLPAGSVTTTTYDYAGRVTMITYPGQVTTYTYTYDGIPKDPSA